MKNKLSINPIESPLILCSEKMVQYIEAEDKDIILDIHKGELLQFRENKITWSYEGEEIISQKIVLSCEFSKDEYELLPGDREFALYNLYRGSSYVINVIAKTKNGEARDTVTFETSKKYPRILNVGGIYTNFRDIGGYEAVQKDGTVKKIKQDLFIRGSCSDNGSDLNLCFLSDKGKDFFENKLKIKTELDFRRDFECNYKDFSLLSGAKYEHKILDAYMCCFMEDQMKAYREAFQIIANPDSYPIYCHCIGGADRTGTVVAILMALLGVSKEEIYEEYEFTSFSGCGLRYRLSIQCVITTLETFFGGNLSENTECYLRYIGLTPEEIYRIKVIFLGLDMKDYVYKPRYGLVRKEFFISPHEKKDMIMYLVDEVPVSKITICGKNVDYSILGKIITIKSSEISFGKQGEYEGSIYFENGEDYDFKIYVGDIDLSEGLSVTGLSLNEEEGYCYVFIKYPSCIFNDIHHHFWTQISDFPEVLNHILVNNEKITTINEKKLPLSYFRREPGLIDERHRIPVSCHAYGDTMKLLISADWIKETIGRVDERLSITFLPGLSFQNDNKTYVLNKRKTFIYWGGQFREITTKG